VNPEGIRAAGCGDPAHPIDSDGQGLTVAGNRGEPNPLRRRAAEEIDRCEVKLLTVGALFGQMLQSHGTNCFRLGMDLLSDESSPKEWVQNGVASWIQCYESQVALYKGLCNVICPSPGTDDKTYGGKVGPDVLFVLDIYAEATQPVATDIPAAAIDNVTIAPGLGSSIDRHIRLSR